MYLKYVHIKNIQSHKDTEFEFNEKGMCFFEGDNSHGKSVFTKTMLRCLRGHLSKPRVRKTLVSRWSQVGEITQIRSDNAELYIHINKEKANDTYATLTLPGNQPITRYLADGNIVQLFTIFGWHYDSNAELSLNICDELGTGLFFNTSSRQNYAVASQALCDTRADTSLENLTEALKMIRGIQRDVTTQYEALKTSRTAITLWDEEEQGTRKTLLSSYLAVLRALDMPEFPALVAPIRVRGISLYPFPRLIYPPILNLSEPFPDIVQEMKDMQELVNGKCPTCGRSLC